MDNLLYEKYIQRIEDLIFIENKIVTCLWLCQVLKIHANTAKQLLFSFSARDDIKNKLLITYIIGGELKNGKGKLLKLVIADSKDSFKQLLLKVTTDHIFSVQKSVDSFSSVDVFNSFPNFIVSEETRKFCPIQPSCEIKKREVKHIVEVKNFINPKVTVAKQNTAKTNEIIKKEIKINDEKVSKETSPDSSKPQPKEKKTHGNKDVKNTKAGSIGSFFSKQAQKKSSEKPTDINQKTNKKEENPKNGINSFFKPSIKNEFAKNDIKENNGNITPKSNKVESEAEEMELDNEHPIPATPTTKEKKMKDKKKRKRKKKDHDGNQTKKRKRIMAAISSDSESSANESSECEMEVEPEELPPPPVEEEEDIIPPTPGRKRVRKQIDKVFTDDNGFIITKKEFTYESCSDDETKDSVKENKESNTTKTDMQKVSEKVKEVSPKNSKKNVSKSNDKCNKQSSLMSFFKRK